MQSTYSRGGGGPAPEGNGSRPVHSCPCGAMYTGGGHRCLGDRAQHVATSQDAEGRQAQHERAEDREAGG